MEQMAARAAVAAAAADDGAPSRLSWSALLPDSDCAPRDGGYGVVFRAQLVRAHARPGAPTTAVAVKLLKLRDSGLDGVGLERATAALEAEAAVLQRATSDQENKHVVCLFGIARGEAPQAWLDVLGIFSASVLTESPGGGKRSLMGMVMQWEGGGTLFELVHAPQRGLWTAKMATRIRLLVEVSTGLWYLHNMVDGVIVHSDLKAENVLLSEGAEPHARLADFGFAQLRGDASSVMSRRSQADGERGRGTYPYMAPELFRNRRKNLAALVPSRSTDVYSFGTIMWEMLSGGIPWFGFSEGERIEALRDGETLDMSRLPPDTPAEVRNVLQRALAFRREERPRITELHTVLRLALDRIVAGSFDAFFSYSWGAGAVRKKLIDEVYATLTTAGLRIWLDARSDGSGEMGHNLKTSMRAGLAAASVTVVFFSPDYAQSANCLFELREAAALGKPIVACKVEPGPWKAWLHADGSGERAVPDDHDLVSLAHLDSHLFADLSDASLIDWADETAASASRHLLVLRPEAVPRIKALVSEHVIDKRALPIPDSKGGAGAGLGRSSGSSGGLPSSVRSDSFRGAESPEPVQPASQLELLLLPPAAAARVRLAATAPVASLPAAAEAAVSCWAAFCGSPPTAASTSRIAPSPPAPVMAVAASAAALINSPPRAPPPRTQSAATELPGSTFVARTHDHASLKLAGVADKSSLKGCIAELRRGGLTSSQLMVFLDFSRDALALYGEPGGEPSPMLQALNTIGNTLTEFDSDQRFPVFSFGDEQGGTARAVPLCSDSAGFDGFPAALAACTGLAPRILTGEIRGQAKRSLVPVVRCAIDAVRGAGSRELTIVLCLISGPLSGVCMEESCVALVEASKHPIAFVLVGIDRTGTQDYGNLKSLDDEMELIAAAVGGKQHFDNVTFVDFARLKRKVLKRGVGADVEAALAQACLHEIPQVLHDCRALGFIN